ncbi:inner membrane protein YbjM [Enterobacteriaceae bacterium ESL0689]|nr:inner membrane protein YbjM [Enterobacteriaceae bacterium ESL0689]
MKSENARIDIICGFCLFTMVFLLLLLSMNCTFQVADYPQMGLLLFLLPGATASCLSSGRRVIRPLLGAMLAMPVCLVIMQLFFTDQDTLWQQLAWLFSAVFWCASGALCSLFIDSWLSRRDKCPLKK